MHFLLLLLLKVLSLAPGEIHFPGQSITKCNKTTTSIRLLLTAIRIEIPGHLYLGNIRDTCSLRGDRGGSICNMFISITLGIIFCNHVQSSMQKLPKQQTRKVKMKNTLSSGMILIKIYYDNWNHCSVCPLLSFLGKTFNTNQFCLCLTRWSNTIKQTDLLAFVFDAIATISKASFSCIIIRQGKKLFSSFPIFGKKSMRQMHLYSPELVVLANSVHSSFTHNASWKNGSWNVLIQNFRCF